MEYVEVIGKVVGFVAFFGMIILPMVATITGLLINGFVDLFIY